MKPVLKKIATTGSPKVSFLCLCIPTLFPSNVIVGDSKGQTRVLNAKSEGQFLQHSQNTNKSAINALLFYNEYSLVTASDAKYF